jgi:hypothetical protein
MHENKSEVEKNFKGWKSSLFKSLAIKKKAIVIVDFEP